MKIKVVTSYKPGTFDAFTKRSIQSILDNWPGDVKIHIYHESQTNDIFEHPRIKWIDLHQAQPALVAFKTKHKDDPVANGELQEIEGGVKRQGSGPNAEGKGSFLFQAVRFSNKVFCVTHALKNHNDYDYVVWLDADTYTFRKMPIEVLKDLLPNDTLITYLGRENPKLNDGGKDPECGFVGYNLHHPDIQSFADDWEKMYTEGEVFDLSWGWTDCSTLWHLSKKYRREKNTKVNDIGKAAGVKGHHVFINSKLGLYIDHFKGKRKQMGTSVINDFKDMGAEATKLDYWKQVPKVMPKKQ